MLNLAEVEKVQLVSRMEMIMIMTGLGVAPFTYDPFTYHPFYLPVVGKRVADHHHQHFIL